MTLSDRHVYVSHAVSETTHAEVLLEQSKDLLRSLMNSIQSLRQEVECWHDMLKTSLDLDPELMEQKPYVSKLESLIRECHKVERTLVEQLRTASGAEDAGFDAEAARVQLMGRLARLQEHEDQTKLPDDAG
ncbi:recombinase [Epibacterium ulvae]|uniref:recombinase n=1 Tax=Epibacterium ulvae TaxID=1156985 RepID=UPI0024901F43|nr:recombinase [Epibacterium ulvae]